MFETHSEVRAQNRTSLRLFFLFLLLRAENPTACPSNVTFLLVCAAVLENRFSCGMDWFTVLGNPSTSRWPIPRLAQSLTSAGENRD